MQDRASCSSGSMPWWPELAGPTIFLRRVQTWRSFAPLDSRGRLSSRDPRWLQHERGRSRLHCESLTAAFRLVMQRIHLEPIVRQGSLPPSAAPTPDRFRSQWRPESPLCARSGPLAGRFGLTGGPIAVPGALSRGFGRRSSRSLPLNFGGPTLLLRPLRWSVGSSQCSCALFLRLKCPAIQVSAAD